MCGQDLCLPIRNIIEEMWKTPKDCGVEKAPSVSSQEENLTRDKETCLLLFIMLTATNQAAHERMERYTDAAA